MQTSDTPISVGDKQYFWSVNLNNELNIRSIDGQVIFHQIVNVDAIENYHVDHFFVFAFLLSKVAIA